MPIPNIQNNKYTPGPLPEVYAARSELLARLEQAAEKKLMLVTAPAGSGKTVSALLWMRASGRKTVWIGLDALDNSTDVFYRMLCTGVLSAQPNNKRMAAILRDPAFASAPVEHTVSLLAEFYMDEGKYALALDDFHTITNQEIVKSLPLILRRLPHCFVTLILSRAEPGEAFAELAESGQAAVIGPGDLAFGEDEIKAYFASLGRYMAQGEAEAAYVFTGGWAIGVNALAQSDFPVPDGHGGHALERYIGKHVWAKWDENLRAFMLASAAVDEMPVVLCEIITGRADAGALLESLRAQNAFVTRTGDGVYRYHHLFLDFLRARTEYIQAEKGESFRAAAQYYLSHGDYVSARRYAYKSGDARVMMDALYAIAENRGISIEEYLSFARDFFMSRPMEDICEKLPALYADYATTAFLCGDARAFEMCEDRLYARLPDILQNYPQFCELVFMMFAMDYRVGIAEIIEKAVLLPPIQYMGEELRGVSVNFQMPFLHRSCRDFHDLTDKALHSKMKTAFGKLLKNHYELMVHGISAGLLLEQNHVSDALLEAQAAMSALNSSTVNEMRFAAYMHLAASYHALGKDAELSAFMDEVGRLVDDNAQYLRPNLLAFTTRIKLWNGDGEAAREWLDNYFVTDSRMLEPYRVYQYFTTARAHAAQGELEKAKDLAIRLRRLGEDFRRPLDAAEAGALISAILWASGQKKEAQEMMETVLLETQPRAFIRVIADEGAEVVPVLKKVMTKSERADYKGGLDRVYVNSVYLAAYAVSKQRSGIMAGLEAKPVKLSRQQKMILSLLAQGYKREDIMEKTGLTLNTVKTHTRMAYSKLGVSTAADAVVRAQELGVIE